MTGVRPERGLFLMSLEHFHGNAYPSQLVSSY